MRQFIDLFGRVPVGVLLVLSATSVIAGDYFSKLWSVDQRSLFYWLGLAGYCLSGFFYIPTLLREGLIVTSIIWLLISVAGFIIIGTVLFKEVLSPLQITGIVLATISLVILSWQ